MRTTDLPKRSSKGAIAGRPRKRIGGLVALCLQQAQLILDVRARRGGYIDVLDGLGFVPVVPVPHPYRIMGLEELDAWAMGIIRSDDAKQAIAAEVEAELRRRGINPTEMTDIVAVVNGRMTVMDTAHLTQQQRAAIAEIAQTEHGLKIKLHDPIPALRLLGQASGRAPGGTIGVPASLGAEPEQALIQDPVAARLTVERRVLEIFEQAAQFQPPTIEVKSNGEAEAEDEEP